MEQSILTSTKEMLDIGPDDPSFDLPVMTHINSAFSTLHQLGVGPTDPFEIEDAEPEWSAFVVQPGVSISMVKTYIWAKVKLAFDPPQTSYLLTATEKQVEQAEGRLNIARESTEWVDPDPPVVIEDE